MASGWVILLIFIVLVFLAVVVLQITMYADTNGKKGAYERETVASDRPVANCNRMVISIDGWKPSMDLITKILALPFRTLGDMAQAGKSFPKDDSMFGIKQLPSSTKRIQRTVNNVMTKLQAIKQECLKSLGRFDGINKAIADTSVVASVGTSSPQITTSRDQLRNSLNYEIMQFRTLLVDASDEIIGASNLINFDIANAELSKRPYLEKVNEYIVVRSALLESLMSTLLPDDIIESSQPYDSYDDSYKEYEAFSKKREIFEQDDSDFKDIFALSSTAWSSPSMWSYDAAISVLQTYGRILRYLLPYTIVPAGAQVSDDKYTYIECACEFITMLAKMAASLVKTYRKNVFEL